ncbi:MAG: enoyl-CoA hydratase/isomerase family protein [Candidatus Binatia bacterium]|nr:enoyl-CoA hydratase/isomerase family protein [Candidatus Binatia bacterium]
MSNRVQLSRPREGVALIEMNTADIGGFVSWEAVNGLADALQEARESGVRVSVLSSAFAGHWFEHAWLRDICDMITKKPTSGPAEGWFRTLSELAAPEVVTIAAVSGSCAGGGAELGWACDLRVAEEQATFSQPEVLLGLTTGIGGTSRLMRLVGRTVAAEMVLDGAPMPARRIYELGGVNRVVPEGGAVKAALDWAERLAGRPAAALAALKRILNDNDDKPLTEALRNEQVEFQKIASTPDAIALMERTQARFDAGESIREVYGPAREED